jgi:hypothetical protein
MVPRRTFGTKGEEVVGGWRRLHNNGLHKLYTSPNFIRLVKSRRMRWGGHIALMEKMGSTCSVLVGKSDWKRPLRKSRYSWECSIEMGVWEIG